MKATTYDSSGLPKSSQNGGVSVSGTPSAGNYARWTDADTLEARTTAQVRADIGAPDISGTPVAGQVAVWSDADTLGGLRCWRAQLSHATYSNGELITLPFLASGGAADGEYYAKIVRRATGANTTQVHNIGFRIASNAVSGTPLNASCATTAASVARVAISGGAVCVWLNNTAAADIYIEVWTNVATAGGAFAITDAAATGTSASSSNGVTTLTAATAAIIGTDPGGSDPLRVGGGVTHSGAVTMSGSPASAGASVRNRHGHGGTTDIVDNVPSSGGIRWTQNGSNIFGFASDKSVIIDTTFASSLATALGGGAPTGSIAMWGTGTAPTGWLLADGSAVSRTTYSALFALIGTTFGAGDGSTTFALPDFRGRAPIGAGTGSGLTARTLAGTVGAETHTLTAAESGLPSHTHTIGGADTPNYAWGTNPLKGTGSGASTDTGSTGGTGASSAHNNMQPSLVVNFIIKT